MNTTVLRLSLAFLAVVCCFCHFGFTSPLNPKTYSNGVSFLSKYGYLVPKDPKQGQIMSQSDLVESVKSLQRFAGLNETGVLDAATIALMGKSRCGMPDKSPADKARRKRRYTMHGTYWRKRDLTYRIKGWTSDVTMTDQRRIYKWAFAQWSSVTKLTITEAPSHLPDDKVDILIDWKRGYHGDGYPFDGQGGTLAHAFYPLNNEGISGDAHFDDDEQYTVGRKDGINLDWVALHEFGHSLGLDHSNVRGSIMFPWYQGYKPTIKLTEDDILGIQGIYGKRRGGVLPTGPVATADPSGPPPTRRPTVDECRIDKYDAWMYDSKEDRTFAFVGDYYFVVNPRTVGVMEGPNRIAEKWKGVRTPISSVYQRPDGRVVFFSGDKYWQFSDSRLVEGPRPLRDYGINDEGLKDMDGILVWGRNQKTYMFKGNHYWRYNERYRHLDSGYPRDISIWKGVPGNLDAIMKWKNGKTYFFKGRDYYKLDDYSITAEAGYPKSIAIKWMRCDISRLVIPSTAMPTQTPDNKDKESQNVGADRSSSTAVLPSIVMLVVSALSAGKFF